MKKTARIFLFSALVLTSACSGKTDSAAPGAASGSASSDMPKRYELQSGVVHYETAETMGVKIVETLYFDDYGRKEARESVTESNIMGMKSREHKMTITSGDYVISYEVEKSVNGKDETSREATRTNIREFRQMALALGSTLDPAEMKKNMDYREEGSETVAGVTGTKFSIALDKNQPESRVYGVLYKNISMKSQMGAITTVAKQIEENVAVPASKFEVPSGYTIKDVNLQEEMDKASAAGGRE
ncbi:MAG: hypothetical protein HGB29_03640 [Chlorobiaceae bacterium]|nr:hypothetical protein [Chlorobiaceae bacterium]NTW73936.1 hypothetical protein [Chlorobiaceae bacterium]